VQSLSLMKNVVLLVTFLGVGSFTTSPAWKWRRDGLPFGQRLGIEGENETL